MRLVLRSILIAAFLAASCAAAAGPLEDGEAAYRRNDYAAALALLRPLADQGDATAQVYLALMYEFGHGVWRNTAEAAKWYRLSANQGNAAAQFKFGKLKAEGRGVAQNDAEAVRWFRLAADQGDPDAQSYLGLMYERGRGVAQIYSEAVKWVSPRR